MVQAWDLLGEIRFVTSRSGGPGGQNVNKVSSKVTLLWPVADSVVLSQEQRELLISKWSTQLTRAGELQIISQESRSQLQNKEEALRKLDALLRKAFTPKKKRTATKPTKASKRKRLDEKKLRSEKKQWRQRLD